MLLFIQNVISMSFFMGSTQKDMHHSRSIYGAAATMTLIAGVSSIISFTSGTRRICQDALGIETYYTQWAEWMVTVPLLAYITIAIEDKRSTTSEDKSALVSMFLMIFFFFAMNFVKNSPVYGWTLFSLGNFCYGGLLRMVWRSRTKAVAAQTKPASMTRSWGPERSTMKCRLSILLLLVMPMFPFVYLLRLTGTINRYGHH
jgi:hypothetical protein